MSPEDLAFAGAARQAELVRDGEVSSRELVELYLERIERIDPQLNAYRTVMAERALADADQADARRKANADRPLLGVPIAVKDNQDVAGEITTHGTSAHGGPAGADSEIVKRVRAAGAVLIGKTNLPELAIMGATESAGFGVTRNPWDTDRTPGGSSGGSAAAVAAGLCAAATASDGAGSIRIPAACCGLFGLKPQRGRISMAPARDHWHGLSVLGFETRGVRDSALLLDIAAGAGPGDAHSAPPSDEPFADAAARPPGRLRVAVSTRPPVLAPPATAELRGALDDVAEVLRSLGHQVERQSPSYGQAGNALIVRYFRGIRDDAVAMPRPERLQRRTRGFARIGSLLPDSALDWAMRNEAGYVERIGRLFDDFDVLLMPATAKPPVRADEWEGLGAVRTFMGLAQAYPYTGIWNLTGQPAATVPAGFTDDGLPLGAQLVVRPNDEATLLSLAAQLEAERPWDDRRPPVA
ncbi:MAG: amidase [Thermoleophilaceae bacterium]